MSTERTRVGLLFGGSTPEHEVSIVSARGVWNGFDRSRIDPVPIAVDPNGRWLPPGASLDVLDGGAARVPDAEPGSDVVTVEPGRTLAVVGAEGTRSALALDVVFPVIHGWGGEDGRLQGMLDWIGMPCVGSGVTGSAVAMDKAFARTIVASAGIAVAPWTLVRASDWTEDPSRVTRAILDRPGLPAFVKPANAGSSIGISRVLDERGLPEAIEVALAFDDRVVVERALDAREIEIAVLGNERPDASVAGEIVPAAEFYTYDDKYHDGRAVLHVPAPLDPTVADEIRGRAVDAFLSLDLHGMARVDFFFEERTASVWFSEANTLPGFTPISMYSKLWEASGVPYGGLLTRLVELALERSVSRGRAGDR